MVRIPFSQSTLMENKKVVIFWDWCRMDGIQGVFVVKNNACVCTIVSPLVSPLCIFYQYCLVLSARSVARGADAIIKLTHGHEEAHCPNRFKGATACLHL